jgi:hypothetical protein
MTEEVEHLPSKCEALNSNPTPHTQNKIKIKSYTKNKINK